MIDPTSDTCNQLKNRTIQMEIEILHTLGYEVQRLLNTPHKFLLMFLKTLKADKHLAETAFNFCNDSFLTSAPLHYPPELLATSCIYLAYRATRQSMPKVAWWLLADYTFDLLEEAASSIFESYNLGVPSLEETVDLVQNFGRLKDRAFFSSVQLGFTYYQAHAEMQCLKGQAAEKPSKENGSKRLVDETDNQKRSDSRSRLESKERKKDKRKKHKKRKSSRSLSSKSRRR